LEKSGTGWTKDDSKRSSFVLSSSTRVRVGVRVQDRFRILGLRLRNVRVRLREVRNGVEKGRLEKKFFCSFFFN
jgi:hypothetical protein